MFHKNFHNFATKYQILFKLEADESLDIRLKLKIKNTICQKITLWTLWSTLRSWFRLPKSAMDEFGLCENTYSGRHRSLKFIFLKIFYNEFLLYPHDRENMKSFATSYKNSNIKIGIFLSKFYSILLSLNVSKNASIMKINMAIKTWKWQNFFSVWENQNQFDSLHALRMWPATTKWA